MIAPEAEEAETDSSAAVAEEVRTDVSVLAVQVEEAAVMFATLAREYQAVR
jgi:hypothetical protein